MAITVKLAKNQKQITIIKCKCDDKDVKNYYARINLDALNRAMKDLSGNTFKMWLYLVKNQSHYTFALSEVDAVQNWGIGSSSSYDRAVKELQSKGYLVKVSPFEEEYEFFDNPYRI